MSNYMANMPPRWVWIFLGVNALMVVGNVVTFLLSRLFHLEPISLFRLSDEANIPTWWSSMQLLMIAQVLGVMAYYLVDRRNWRTWGLWLAVAVFAFLSMDELAVIHERIGHAWGPRALRTGMWVPILTPVFVMVVVLVGRAIWPILRPYPAVMKRLAAGIILLLVSAVGIELIANFFEDQSMAVNICVIFEEFGEMCAGTLMLWAAVDWMHLSGIRLAVRQPAGAATARTAALVPENGPAGEPQAVDSVSSKSAG